MLYDDSSPQSLLFPNDISPPLGTSAQDTIVPLIAQTAPCFGTSFLVFPSFFQWFCFSSSNTGELCRFLSLSSLSPHPGIGVRVSRLLFLHSPFHAVFLVSTSCSRAPFEGYLTLFAAHVPFLDQDR